MMLGDIAYGDMFHPDKNDANIRYTFMTYVTFIMFLLLGLMITNMWVSKHVHQFTILYLKIVLSLCENDHIYILFNVSSNHSLHMTLVKLVEYAILIN